MHCREVFSREGNGGAGSSLKRNHVYSQETFGTLWEMLLIIAFAELYAVQPVKYGSWRPGKAC